MQPSANHMEREELEGYVVDVACLRKYPRGELLERARAHSKGCGLMGHCIESGYGLVDAGGELRLLDSAATPAVVEALKRTTREAGIYLRAVRERDGAEMKTSRLEESTALD